MKYLTTLDSKMETKMITKTIKELADEYDGNVEQLHREICKCEAYILRLKSDNNFLENRIELEHLARARAEKTSEASIFIMFTCVASMFVLLAKNILIG